MLAARSSMQIALALAATVLPPRTAAAHFVLHAPASWREQGSVGDPQKMGPCGDVDSPAAPTGIVTAFSPGGRITITIDEAIYHPGHYRVALAVNDRSELPAEPPVTPGQYTDCGSAAIMDPPVFPVLADGMLQHTQSFHDVQSFTVTLPADVTCDHCTLQVIEFMSQHDSPCFYHHCADISIKAGATPPGGCQADAECADDSACTTDRCNTTTHVCEHVDEVTATCDDGDACTRDACTAAQGCVSTLMTLADVRSGFLGTPQASACANDKVPKAIGSLFAKADGLVTRAADNPTKAARLLQKAAKRLRSAGTKVTKSSPRKISAACAQALGAVVDQARGRITCLLNAV
jgi:hypothetical protein